MNRQRIGIILDGNHYTLSPSFTGLSKLEEELDISLITLASRLSEERITLKEISAILHHCLNDNIPRESIEKWLMQGGMERGIQAVVIMLSGIFSCQQDSQPVGIPTAEELNSLRATFPDVTGLVDNVQTTP